MAKVKAKINPRRLITSGGTLVCALGIGYLMQSNAQEHQPRVQAAPVTDVQSKTLEGLPETELEISEIKLTSADATSAISVTRTIVGKPNVRASSAEVAPKESDVVEAPAPVLTCHYSATAEPSVAAMVTLKISAPCAAKGRFTVHHNGMMFTDRMGESGTTELTVPALSVNPVYIVDFENGEGAVARTEVPSLEYYDRVAVQWTGRSGLQIHAFEYGSAYGDLGHVWADDAGDIATAARGEGGFLTRHGAADLENSKRVEVYTFPTGTAAQSGNVRLSLEAEVTSENCGRNIEAQSFQIDGAALLKVREVVLSMPECNAVGDFLVLKNLLNDLKIASN